MLSDTLNKKADNKLKPITTLFAKKAQFKCELGFLHCAYRYIVYKLFRTHTLQFLGIGGTDYAVERKYEDG